MDPAQRTLPEWCEEGPAMDAEWVSGDARGNERSTWGRLGTVSKPAPMIVGG